MSDAIEQSKAGSLPPPPLPLMAPAPVLGYAIPTGFVPGGQWRDGDRLVIDKRSTFLNCCIKCGTTENLKRWQKQFWWHSAWWYLMLLVPGPLIFIIVSMCIRKGVKPQLMICGKHRSRRRWLVLLTWLLSLVSIAALTAGFVTAGNAPHGQEYRALYGVGGFFVLLIAACVVGFGYAPVLSPKKIDNHYAWFTRAGSQYLDQLPPANSRT